MFTKFTDEVSLEILEFDMHGELGDFYVCVAEETGKKKSKIFGDLQKAASIFLVKVGQTKHLQNRKL